MILLMKTLKNQNNNWVENLDENVIENKIDNEIENPDECVLDSNTSHLENIQESQPANQPLSKYKYLSNNEDNEDYNKIPDLSPKLPDSNFSKDDKYMIYIFPLILQRKW